MMMSTVGETITVTNRLTVVKRVTEEKWTTVWGKAINGVFFCVFDIISMRPLIAELLIGKRSKIALSSTPDLAHANKRHILASLIV